MTARPTRAICSVPTCGRLVQGAGYCSKHYRRVKRTGTYAAPQRRYFVTNKGRAAIGLPPRYVEVPL